MSILPLSFSLPQLIIHSRFNFLVMADDPDSGSNGEIKFSLADGEGDEGAASVPFAVDAHSGWVTTTAALDREARAEYRLPLLASDAAAQRRSARGTLVVRLVDYNDCPPRFTQDTYSAEVRSVRHLLKEVGSGTT